MSFDYDVYEAVLCWGWRHSAPSDDMQFCLVRNSFVLRDIRFVILSDVIQLHMTSFGSMFGRQLRHAIRFKAILTSCSKVTSYGFEW